MEGLNSKNKNIKDGESSSYLIKFFPIPFSSHHLYSKVNLL